MTARLARLAALPLFKAGGVLARLRGPTLFQLGAFCMVAGLQFAMLARELGLLGLKAGQFLR